MRARVGNNILITVIPQIKHSHTSNRGHKSVRVGAIVYSLPYRRSRLLIYIRAKAECPTLATSSELCTAIRQQHMGKGKRPRSADKNNSTS